MGTVNVFILIFNIRAQLMSGPFGLRKTELTNKNQMTSKILFLRIIPAEIPFLINKHY
mgnify:CR=1 FL=1